MPAGQCNLKVRKNERKSVNVRGVSCDSTQIACQDRYKSRKLFTSKTEINPDGNQTDDVNEFANKTNSEIRMRRGNTTRNKYDISLHKKRNTVILEDVEDSQQNFDVITVSNEGSRSRIPYSISTKKGRSSAAVEAIEAVDVPIKTSTRLTRRSLQTINKGVSLCESAELQTNLIETQKSSVQVTTDESDIVRKTKKNRVQESVRTVNIDVSLSENLDFRNNSTKPSDELIIPTKKRRRSLRIGKNCITDDQVQVTNNNQFSDLQSSVIQPGKPNLSSTIHYLSISALDKNSLADNTDNLHFDLSGAALIDSREKSINQTEFLHIDNTNNCGYVKNRTLRQPNKNGVESEFSDNRILISSAERVKRYPRNRLKDVTESPYSSGVSTISKCSTSIDDNIVVSPSTEPVHEKLKVKWNARKKNRRLKETNTDPQLERTKSKLKDTELNATEQTSNILSDPEVATISRDKAKTPNNGAIHLLKNNQRDTSSPGKDSNQSLQNSEEDICAALLKKYTTINKCNFNVNLVLERFTVSPPVKVDPNQQKEYCDLQQTRRNSEDHFLEDTDNSLNNASMSPVYIKMRSNDDVLVDMTNYHTDGSIKFDISSPSSGCCTYTDSPLNEAGIIVRRIETEGGLLELGCEQRNEQGLRVIGAANRLALTYDNVLPSVSDSLLDECDNVVVRRSSGLPITPGGRDSTITVLENDNSAEEFNVATPPIANLVCSIQHVELNCTISPITPKPDENDKVDKYRIGFNNSVTRYVSNAHQTLAKQPSKTGKAVKSSDTAVCSDDNNQVNKICRVYSENYVKTPEPVNVELPVKQIKSPETRKIQTKRKSRISLEDNVQSTMPEETAHRKEKSKSKSKISLNRVDEISGVNETTKNADKIEETILDNVKSQEQLKKKNCQFVRKINLKRNTQCPAAKATDMNIDKAAISLSETVNTHTEAQGMPKKRARNNQFPAIKESYAVADSTQIANKPEKSALEYALSHDEKRGNVPQENPQPKRRTKNNQFPATKESNAAEDLLKIADEPEKSVLGTALSLEEKRYNASQKNIPPKKSTKDNQFPLTNKSCTVENVSQIPNKAEKSILETALWHKENRTNSPEKHVQPQKNYRSVLQKVEQFTKLKEISEVGVKTRSRSNVINNTQIIQLREPVSFEPRKLLTVQEEKSLLANIKSLELPCVPPTDKSTHTINLYRNNQATSDAHCEVDGITKILPNKAHQNIQFTKPDETLSISGITKLPDKSQKNEKALEEIDIHPPAKIIHPKTAISLKNNQSSAATEVCALSDKKTIVEDVSGVKGIKKLLEKKNSKSPKSLDDMFAIPAVPPRKRRRIIYDDSPIASSAEIVTKVQDAEKESVKLTTKTKEVATMPKKEKESITLTAKRKEAVKFADRSKEAANVPEKEKDCIKLSDRSKEVIKLAKKKEESLELANKERESLELANKEQESLELANKKTELTKLPDKEFINKTTTALPDKNKESINKSTTSSFVSRSESIYSSEGSEDKEVNSVSSEEYYSRNKHNFKFTDKGNMTPCVNAKRKIKLKRPVILDVTTSSSTGQQSAPKTKLAVDCDIISIYADTIGNDAISERAFDFDTNIEDSHFDKSRKVCDIKPNDLVSEWLRGSVMPVINNRVEQTVDPLTNPVSAEDAPRPNAIVNDKPVEISLPVKCTQSMKQQPTRITGNVKNERVILQKVPVPLLASPKVQDTWSSENIFQFMCIHFKKEGTCRKRMNCRYQHTFPIGWETSLKNMPKESLVNLYNSIKKEKSLFVFKKIFSTVAMELGIQRDFNSVVGLVKDVLEINIDSDRTPFINYIIEALGTIGLTYHSTVEVIFNSTCVDTHLKDLLTDILINITVEHGDFEKNWSAMQLLVKHRNFNVDNGIIQATLMECVKESMLQKELCLKVYNDLMSRIPDEKLKTIFKSLLRDYLECMRELGLVNEANKLYDRCTALSLLLNGQCCNTPSSSSNNSIHSIKTASDVSPMRPNSITEQNLTNTSKNTSSPLYKVKISPQLSNHTVQPNPSVLFRKQVVNKVSPWSNKPNNLFLKDATQVKPDNNPSTSVYVAPYIEKWPGAKVNEVKQAIYTEDLSKLMSLILQYKESEQADQFLKICIETMQESAQQFFNLFRNLCQSVALIQKSHETSRDISLEYIFKTIGMNLIIYSTQKDKWDQAHMIYQTLCGLYKENDIMKVKMLIDYKPSYIKRLLIISRIFIKTGDFKHAWWLFKENGLLLTSSWGKDLNEQDVEYKNTVFIELLTILSKSRQWPVAFNIVQYVLMNDLNELYSLLNNLILVAIKNECHMDYVVSFMSVCPVWYQRVHKNTFRIILIKIMKCGMQKLAQNLYNMGCELNIYHSIFGNEKCVEISTHFVFEEIQLMVNILLTKMLNYMPITYPIVISVKQSSEIVDDTGTEVPNLLYQNNITCETMRVRIVNILNNYIKPPIMVINQNNKLVITPQQLHKHLTIRCRMNELY